MIHIASLRTVVPDIEQDLAQAQQWLEYLHVSRDETHLASLQQALARCIGALSMAGLADAALLLQALNDAATQLHQRIDEWSDDVISAAAYPLFLVPRYCHWVIEQGQRNGPILLDAINHLRQYSGEKALIESQLLGIVIDPNVSPLKALKNPPASDIKAPLSKIIPLFKKARLAIDKQPEAALNLLAKASIHLQKVCGNAPIAELFWLLSCIIEAMDDGDLRLTKQRRQWLLLVEQQLMTLYKDPDNALKKPLSLAIKREFLALIALSHSTRERSVKLAKLYRLPDLPFSDRDIALGITRMRQPGSDVYQSLVKCIEVAVEQMSHHLAVLLEDQPITDEGRALLVQHMDNISAAVCMCELPHTGDLTQQCRQDIDMLLNNAPSKEVLFRLAEGLLFLPERFKVMADQTLDAAAKTHWTDVSNSELMPQRYFSDSISIVLAHAYKEVSDIILQLDIAHETDSYEVIESLLIRMQNLQHAMSMTHQTEIARACQNLHEQLEPCSIHADASDIEQLAWPMIALQEHIALATYQHHSVSLWPC